MRSTVFDTVSLFLGRFTGEQIHSSSSPIDLGLDSIHLSELEFELLRVYPEAQLKHGFTIRQPTIGDIVRHVERLIGTPHVEKKTGNVQGIPLSAVQRRILFLCRLHPENARQFEERIAFSSKIIDRGRLEVALRRIVMRHAILRTCYESERQFALSATECHFTVDESKRRDDDDELMDIEKDPPIRVTIRRNKIEYTTFIDLHHIAVDGRSIGTFLKASDRELKMMYGSSAHSIPSRPKQYIDDALKNESHSQSLEYWKEKLSGLDNTLLHTDFRRVSDSSIQGNSIEATIPHSLMVSLHNLRRQTSATSFAVLLSLYRLFVYKSAGFIDFPLGVMVENRNEDNRDTIGCYVNTCVLRSQLSPANTFTQFVRDVQQSVHELRNHSSVPFDDVVAAVPTNSDGSTSPLFQVLFVMDNVVVPSSEDGFRMIKTPSRTAKYEQTWYITNYGTEMSIKVEYCSDLFREGTIRSAVGFVLFLLQRLSDGSDIRMNEISLMRPIDQLQYHEEDTYNKRDYPNFNHIIRTKHAIGAVGFERCMIPIKKITKLSDRIARVLKEEYISHYGESHRPDDFLVIFVNRSTNLIPLVLAGLEAGFCLAPISLDWSFDRRREVLSMIGNAVYVTDSEDNDIPGSLCLHLSSVMDMASALHKTSRRVFPRTLSSDILYATFTSGTTGVAKCICNCGEGMGNLLLNYSREYYVGAHSRLYQVINYAFDIFFCDLFLAVVNDAQLTLASGAIPEKREMQQANITHCFVMPAFLNFSEDMDLWSSLDSVLVTGETMQSKAFRTLLSVGVPLHQLYGATEQTINNTSQRLHVISPHRGVGRPYSNLSLRAIDKDGQPTPHYWPALVRYSGPGLARGIYGQLERSMNMFPIDDCLMKEERILRDDERCFDSGDLLRRNKDDNLVFVGRNDHLRKVRGRTVDLMEVEHHLSSITQVSGCLVRLSKDSQQLIAYAVTDKEAKWIKHKLSERLSPHMIPDHIVKLKCFPTNANGKIDVKMLPEPQLEFPALAHLCDPRNELESQLRDIFESLLKKKLSLTDDFFSFGGNSLLAMLAVQRIHSEMRLPLPLKSFFHLRTIARISDLLQGTVLSEIRQSQSKVLSTPTFRVPLSPQQRHLWFQCALDPSGSSGDITMRLSIPEYRDLPMLQSISNTLIMANDALRTTILIEESLPVQYSLSATECFYCIRGEDDTVEKLSAHRRICIGLSRDGGGSRWLLIRFHHILVDGRSLAILQEQLDLLMLEHKLNRRRSFLHHCSSESAISTKMADDWRRYLTDCPDLNLPVENTDKEGHATVTHEITMTRERISESVDRQECTVFHFLLASFNSTLHQLSGQTDFIVGVVHAGRNAETHDIVGLFTNTLPVRVKGKIDVDTVKEIVEFPFTHCTTPLGEIVQTMNPRRITGRNPLFQHVINFQNVSGYRGHEMEIDYVHTTETAFDTCWKIEETEGGFVLRIDYNRAMFGEEFVKKAMEMFANCLSGHVYGSETVVSTPDAVYCFDDLVRRSWLRHLRVESINDDDNFFDIGGHSLTALAVINDISAVIGKEVPLRFIFEHQTLVRFMRCIEEIVNVKETHAEKNKSANSMDVMGIRASPIQVPILKRIMNGGSESFVRAYNITARIRMKKWMSRDELTHRFNRLCQRHPSLRTFFVFEEVFYQRVVSATECYLPIGAPPNNDESVNIFERPPIAVSLHGNELHICISHLNVDGHSMNNLVDELADFREVESHYSIEAFQQFTHEMEKSPSPAAIDYWRKSLDGFVFNPLRSLPRNMRSRLDAGSLTKEYGNVGADIRKICSTHHCTPFVALLASLGVTLQPHSVNRSAPVSIGYPVDLRSTQTEKNIGFATNTLITQVNGRRTSIHELISAVSHHVVDALEHKNTPFDDLLRMSGASTLFDVMLVMDPFSVDDGEEFEVIREAKEFTKFPLTLFVQNSLKEVKITAHFMKDLFTLNSIEVMLNEWEHTLNSWASGQHRQPSNDHGEPVETIVQRQQQFVRVEDLTQLCASVARSRVSLENRRIILDYESAVYEPVIINFIKHNVPLCLHPDELRSSVFPADIPSFFPLSPQQLQMYFLSREDSSCHYNVPFVQRFSKSSVNGYHLTLALQHIRQRNEALRTRLSEKDGEPIQIVLSATESYYCVETVSDTDEEVTSRINSPRELSLNLHHSTARLRLFDTGDQLVLLLVISHVICDGWSTSLLQEQLSTVYEQLQNGEKPVPVNRHSWEEYANILQSDILSREVDERYLNDVMDNLSTRECTIEDGVGMSRTVHLNRLAYATIGKKASSLESTPFAIILQAIAHSIHSVFGMETLNIGTPVANRSSSSIDVVGCFMNTLVVPLHCTDSSRMSVHSSLSLNIPNFQLLKAVRSRLKKADIRLFDVFVNCRYGMESERNVRVKGVKKSEIHKISPIYPLEFYIEEEDGQYAVEVKMKKGNEKTMDSLVAALHEHFECKDGVETDTITGETTWMSKSQCEDIPQLDLASILYRNSNINGESIALQTPNRKLSYAELWRLLEGMARNIRKEFFMTTGEILRADDVVGVRMQHGKDAILSCLSVLVAGAAYLPLLHNWPEERVRHAVNETACALVLDDGGMISHTVPRASCRWRRRNLIEDAAYVIYTSGTTGKPKGVIAVHRGVINMLNFTVRDLAMRKDDVIFQFTKFVFDNSVLEIWLALASGATLFIDDSPFTHHRFISAIPCFGITHALLFPGLVAAFTDDQLSLLSSLRVWCMGAEKASQPLVDSAVEKGITIVQVYGPTETTTYALSRFMKRGDHANNLGRALPNTTLRVTYDDEKTGELFITGEGLMRGYVGRSKEESFVDGYYATGDVVRMQKDGNVVFVGRNDSQVKVRGYRVELNEVENALLRFAEQVKVLLFEEQQQLIAFVKSSLTGDQLRSRCDQVLPDYMVPSRFILLTIFPLTDNAKVDVAKLKNMVVTRIKGDYEDRGDESVEQRLVAVFKEVGFRFASLEDNFIEIGGQSIIGMRLMAEIEREFGVSLGTHHLYRMKTLREIIPFLSYEHTPRPVNKNFEEEINEREGTPIGAERIRKIWTSMLGFDTFNYEDNFFLVGGDSFKLLTLHNRLSNEFCIDLSLADLLHNLTITQQVAMLTNRKSEMSPMIRVSNPKNAKGTLVLLHPLIGGVQMPYRNLIAQLGSDYEILGFEHPQTFREDLTVAQFSSLENLIKSYLHNHRIELAKTMRKTVFVGASLGSLLAFEMITQLGVDAELIVIDGTSNHEWNPPIRLTDHRSMINEIVGKYKVEDDVLIDHMVLHSWKLYLLSNDYKPTRNERISVHVFSCGETDLNWSEIALVKSVHRLVGDHSQILNTHNSSFIAHFVRSLF